MKQKLPLFFLLLLVLCGSTAFPQGDCSLPAPGVAPYMYLCNTGTVADLAADGDNLRWYLSETGGTPLAGDTPVIDGTYYVSQTINECESPRSALLVYIITIDDTFITGYLPYCAPRPVSQFPYFYTTRNIYAAAEGGEPLAPDTIMTMGLYYCTIVVNGCESTRAPVYFVIVSESTYYQDADGDGFGNDDVALSSCSYPPGYVNMPGDCDDTDNTVNNCLEIPYTKLTDSDCGSRLYAFDTELYAEEVWDATQYRYEINDGTTIQVLEKGEAFFRLDEFPQYRYSTAYIVRVSAYVNGEWTPYGATCGLISPPTPVTRITPGQCSHVVSDATTAVYADAVPEATMYRFRLVRDGISQIIEKSDPWFNFDDLESYEYEASYTVDVSVQVYGDWGFYGVACNVSTPAAPLNVEENTEFYPPTAWPNPYGEGFTVQIGDGSTEMVSVSVFDMKGCLLEKTTSQPLELRTTKFGAGYVAGIYIVKIKQGTMEKALRVVKK